VRFWRSVASLCGRWASSAVWFSRPVFLINHKSNRGVHICCRCHCRSWSRAPQKEVKGVDVGGEGGGVEEVKCPHRQRGETKLVATGDRPRKSQILGI
jgi:hypothetical protein